MSDRNETPLKRIRRFCVERCMNGSKYEVRLCTDTTCPHHDVRFGRNPHRAGIRPKQVSDAQLTARLATCQPKDVGHAAETGSTATAISEIPPLTDQQLVIAIEKRLGLIDQTREGDTCATPTN